MVRKIKTVLDGKLTKDGAGVRLKRVFGYHQVPMFDPYLMLDFFNSTNPSDYVEGFPWHPHRGIETITFLFSGKIEHGDSLGNKGVINGGDCQWMTAGSGIIHQELPLASELMLGIQLWANLPAADKMITPRYMEIKASSIPVFDEPAGPVKVVAGEYKGMAGPVQRDDIHANFLEVQLSPDSEFAVDTVEGHTVFAVLVSGCARFAPDSPVIDDPGSTCLYDNGSHIKVSSGSKGARFLLVSGKPIGESVAWGGPIVMNTQEELNKAFEEYGNGTFIKNQAEFQN